MKNGTQDASARRLELAVEFLAAALIVRVVTARLWYGSRFRPHRGPRRVPVAVLATLTFFFTVLGTRMTPREIDVF